MPLCCTLVGAKGIRLPEDWDDVKKSFAISLKAIRNLARTPEEIEGLSRKQKKAFIQLFRALDHDFAHLKSFSIYNDSVLDEWAFSESEYEDFAAMYKNIMEELKKPGDDTDSVDEPVHDDYELVAYSKLCIDFEYIVELLQGFVESLDQSSEDYDEASFEAKIRTLREIIVEFSGDNPKLSTLLTKVVDEIEADREKYVGQDISVIINQMRYAAIDKEIQKFAKKWYLNVDDVKYEAYNYRDGELSNENKLKDSADYAAYREVTPDALPKFKFRTQMINEFKEVLMPEIAPLIKRLVGLPTTPLDSQLYTFPQCRLLRNPTHSFFLS